MPTVRETSRPRPVSGLALRQGCSSYIGSGWCAGEVLEGERNALLKLIHSMREEYEATLRVKEDQEAELRGLKVSIKNIQ